MKTTLLTYVWLAATGLGVFIVWGRDPDTIVLFGIPLLIAGPIMFIQNMKKGIAQAVVKELSSQAKTKPENEKK